MSATDRIRESVQRGPFSAHERAAYMSAWEAEALCDLADAARVLSRHLSHDQGGEPCAYMASAVARLDAALARLDGGGEGDDG